MLKEKPLFCVDCIRSTPHVYVGKETPYEDIGLVRGFMAVASLGMSDTAWADHYWKCAVCGKIRKA